MIVENTDQPQSPNAQPTGSSSTPPSADSAVSMTYSDRRKMQSVTSETLNRRVLLGLLLALTIVLGIMIKSFIAPIVVAVTFATLFDPMFRLVNRRVGQKRRGLSSLICCMILLLGLLIPMYIVIHLVAVQAVDLYATAGPRVRTIVEKGREGPIGTLKDSRIVKTLHLENIDWQSLLQEGAKAAGRIGTFVVNKTSMGILAATLNVFVVFFTLFYLFRDGDRLTARLRYLSPLRNEYENSLGTKFSQIARASIQGTLLIGVIQGILGGLTFLTFGIKTWLLWAFVMVILSVIPFTGAWLVMVPAGIIQIILGNTGRGIGILVICIGVVSTIDNVLRPRLVGAQAKLHDLFIFFSTLGGISMFGVWGFIVGPVTAALFVAMLDIYGEEFKTQLKEVHGAPLPASYEAAGDPHGTLPGTKHSLTRKLSALLKHGKRNRT